MPATRYETVSRARDCDVPMTLHEGLDRIWTRPLVPGRHVWACGCVVTLRPARSSGWADFKLGLKRLFLDRVGPPLLED